ncbi:hypothetical protein [Aeromonas sp. R6-2]|uniref:hypothetical protein n=1 Tax=unclassified Aeromonas TaxID=257493 RepID=UPI0034A1BA57
MSPRSWFSWSTGSDRDMAGPKERRLFVRLPDKNNKLHVYHQSHEIAHLSQQGEETWRFDMNTIREARVIALVERRKEQEKEVFQPGMRSERWEIPIIELEISI